MLKPCRKNGSIPTSALAFTFVNNISGGIVHVATAESSMAKTANLPNIMSDGVMCELGGNQKF